MTNSQNEVRKELKKILSEIRTNEEKLKILHAKLDMYQKLCKHEHWDQSKTWSCPDCQYTDPY